MSRRITSGSWTNSARTVLIAMKENEGTMNRERALKVVLVHFLALCRPNERFERFPPGTEPVDDGCWPAEVRCRTRVEA